VQATKNLVDIFLMFLEFFVRRSRLICLSLGLPFRLRDLAKIVTVEQVRFALSTDANNLADANVDEMLKKLVKCVIGVATVRLSVGDHSVRLQ
jgi:hypothetical protein